MQKKIPELIHGLDRHGLTFAHIHVILQNIRNSLSAAMLVLMWDEVHSK